MNVALDATPLTLSCGGLRRYAEQLSLALAGEFPEDDYFLLCDFPFQPPSHPPANLHPVAPSGGPLDRRWWLVGAQRKMTRLGCELIHGTNFVVPWLPLRPSVVTIHDLSPWRNRDWVAGERAWQMHRDSGQPEGFVRRRTPWQVGLGLASMILTPSETIRKEVIGRFGVHPSRVVAVPLAAAPTFRPAEGKKRARPYVVYVGAAGKRKNLPTLLHAWRVVRARAAADLLLIGPKRQSLDLACLGIDGVEFLGEVPDDDLPPWFCGAAAVVYPSLYEGFGLPVLEAMQCGALVLASRIEAVCEVAAGGAVLLDPRDGRAWVEAMSEALLRGDRFTAIRSEARRRAADFSWQRTARRTREVYAEALKRWNG